MSLVRLLSAAGLCLLATAGIVGGVQAPQTAQTPPAAAPQAEAQPGKPHLEIPDTEAATCLICHEGLDQAKVQHAPVADGMCTACHEFSGAGDETRVALAGGAASGNTAPLCLICHDDVGAALKTKHTHAPAASGDCVMCHSPHGSDHERLLTSPQEELCTICHDDVAAALKTKHTHAPAASGECVMCHNPHGSDHERLLTSPQEELCTICHDDVAAALKTEYAHAPAASGECVMCHSPHGSDQERLLNTPQVELCTTCHDDVAERLKLAHPHAPVTVSCAVCHDPHGSTHATQLREATNELCLACHLLKRTPEPQPKTTLFGRDVSPTVAPLISPKRVIRLDRTRRYGHPLMSHPVAGPKDPIDPTKPFTCLSCHLPHGADGPALQRYAGTNPSEACVRCH